MAGTDLIGASHRELWQEVFAELRGAIVLGELAQGSRLVEGPLAQRFGLSRGPVRRALVELERVGLAESLPRRGTRVTVLTPADVDEIYTLRIALEELAIEVATPAAVEASLPVLLSCLDELEAALDRGDRVRAVEEDLAFHRQLCRMSANRRLLDAWELQADQLTMIVAAVQREDPGIAASSGEHRAVAAGLERGDRDAARAALRRHLAASRSVMRAGLGVGRAPTAAPPGARLSR